MANIISPGALILDDLDGDEILRKLERIARVCYKSEDKTGDIEKTKRFIKGLIKSGHLAMLEHFSFSVLFVCDRGVSHEIVRHRIASFAQESTRYCNYKGGMTFIEPTALNFNTDDWRKWKKAMDCCEEQYYELLGKGHTPQEARAVLPNSLKTEIVMTANLREWRHFFKLRACNETGKAHPQMLELTQPLLEEVKKKIPIIFDDLEVKS